MGPICLNALTLHLHLLQNPHFTVSCPVIDPDRAPLGAPARKNLARGSPAHRAARQAVAAMRARRAKPANRARRAAAAGARLSASALLGSPPRAGHGAPPAGGNPTLGRGRSNQQLFDPKAVGA